MLVIEELRSLDSLCGKSKLEVPGNGGVGGRVFRGLPASEDASGVPGPYDPADVLLYCSEPGDRAGAARKSVMIHQVRRKRRTFFRLLVHVSDQT